MYFADLTPYEFGGVEPRSTVLNIGWLSLAHPFQRGTVDDEFIAALRRLSAYPINLYRGSHLCEFCPAPPTKLSPGGIPMLDPLPGTTGNGEIRVFDTNGITYVAPILIVHYVLGHGYLPPKEFVDAVTLTDKIQINWMPPWQAAEPQKMRDRLQGQLEFEIGRQHPLFGTYPQVIGRRIDNDDVAALLHDRRYATIHVAWPTLSSHPLSGAFPRWYVHNNLQDFLNQIERDAAEYG
jgi:hypothetical protein